MAEVPARHRVALAFGESAMRTDFLPRRDSELLYWAGAMAMKLAVDPQRFGVPEEIAQALIQSQQAFAQKLLAASIPVTRTTVAVLEKNDARRALELAARQVAALARATPGVTDVQRIELGIGVRKTGLTRVPVPASRAIPLIVSVWGSSIEIRISDSETGREARPAGVAGAAIYTFIGPAAPAKREQWAYRGNMTRCRGTLQFAADTPPGSRVWVTTSWYNPRGEHGPASNAVCTNLPGGSVAQFGAAA